LTIYCIFYEYESYYYHIFVLNIRQLALLKLLCLT